MLLNIKAKSSSSTPSQADREIFQLESGSTPLHPEDILTCTQEPRSAHQKRFSGAAVVVTYSCLSGHCWVSLGTSQGLKCVRNADDGCYPGDPESTQ